VGGGHLLAPCSDGVSMLYQPCYVNTYLRPHEK
jgi:hypothetical protein